MTNAWQIWAGTEIKIAIHPIAVWTLVSGAAWCNQCSGTCWAYNWFPVSFRYLAKDIMSEIRDFLTSTEHRSLSPALTSTLAKRREEMWRDDRAAEASSASLLKICRLKSSPATTPQCYVDCGVWRPSGGEVTIRQAICKTDFKPSFWPFAYSLVIHYSVIKFKNVLQPAASNLKWIWMFFWAPTT